MRSRISIATGHLLLALVGLSVALISAELGATVYYVFKEGMYVSPSARLASEKNAYVEAVRNQSGSSCAYGDSILVHPYLAHVQTGLGPCGVAHANSKALIGKEYPDNPRPRTAIILVTGGSVAAQFVWDNRNQESYLERILNAEFTGEQFDRFIVLNGGHGAWKQPNQYILFGLYADVLSGVITLDGFNEHYMLGTERRFELPSNSFFQVVQRQDSRFLSGASAAAALTLDAALYRFAARHSLFHVSNFAYLVVDILRSQLRGYATRHPSSKVEEDWVPDAYNQMFALNDKMNDDERVVWSLAQYQKYIRLMHAGAATLGIKSLFLIQPTPAWGKPLTENEKPFAGKTPLMVYKKMNEELTALKERYAIPVYSLGSVFMNVREEIYKDHIHVNALGNEIIARHIADLIEKEWGWPRHRASPATEIQKQSRPAVTVLQ
jgi:hypothetical protein